MVGVRGFEPPTPASRTQYSTRLSYTPTRKPGAPGTEITLRRAAQNKNPRSKLRFTLCQRRTAARGSLTTKTQENARNPRQPGPRSGTCGAESRAGFQTSAIARKREGVQV